MLFSGLSVEGYFDLSRTRFDDRLDFDGGHVEGTLSFREARLNGWFELGVDCGRLTLSRARADDARPLRVSRGVVDMDEFQPTARLIITAQDPKGEEVLERPRLCSLERAEAAYLVLGHV